MKVPVLLFVDVDPTSWADSNGQLVDAEGNFTDDAVRADVRSYVLTLVQNGALIEETAAEVTDVDTTVYGDITVTTRLDPNHPYRFVTTVEDERRRAQTSEQVEDMHRQGLRHLRALAA